MDITIEGGNAASSDDRDEEEDEGLESGEEEEEEEENVAVPTATIYECAEAIVLNCSWNCNTRCFECSKRKKRVPAVAERPAAFGASGSDAEAEAETHKRTRSQMQGGQVGQMRSSQRLSSQRLSLWPGGQRPGGQRRAAITCASADVGRGCLRLSDSGLLNPRSQYEDEDDELEFFIYLVDNVQKADARRQGSAKGKEKGRGKGDTGDTAATHYEAVSLALAMRNHCVHRKVRAYFHDIATHIFYSEAQKVAIFRLFCKAQRVHHALQRFRFALKWKTRCHAPTVDLTFSPIAAASRIVVYIDRTVYTFSANDIVRIVMNALIYVDPHSFFMYSQVKYPANPYTNIRFSRSVLYEMYFQLFAKRTRPLPSLMMHFFRTNFCLTAMNAQHDEEMHSQCVEQYIRDMSVSHMRVQGNCMLNHMETYSDPPIHIDVSSEYSSERFVEEAGPAIRNYIRASSLHHFGDAYQRYYHLAEAYMREYIKRNPMFGRVVKRGVRRLGPRGGGSSAPEGAEGTPAAASVSPLTAHLTAGVDELD